MWEPLERLNRRLVKQLIEWGTRDVRPPGMPLNDFGLLCEQVRPADVILVEGRSLLSGVIQAVTLSSWSHAAMYVGRLRDLPDEALRQRLIEQRDWAPEQQLLVESEMGQGTLIVPIEKYARYHLRICRPRDLLPEDARTVTEYMLSRVGMPYNMRQVFDLLRFMFPYGLMPRRWRSTLFEAHPGEITRAVCSTLIAESFARVRFPILPVIHRGPGSTYRFYRRDTRLIVPRDFDYSPYFDIVKYPFFGGRDIQLYRDMPWDELGVLTRQAADAVALEDR
ncbi:MAG TPA: YiiX/YebB-like N1pC/P60 family cysteine hydrolase [Nevskiales bacterium]|nr:YiiX/YebB-like N1pC/P60 family cysteine hydrolase [Nevskiales bacterium]